MNALLPRADVISLVPSRSGDFRTGFIGVLKMNAGSSPERVKELNPRPEVPRMAGNETMVDQEIIIPII